MRYYFEAMSEDRYQGYITMFDGNTYQYNLLTQDGSEACLSNIVTGECYPIVYIIADDEHEIFVTEV